MSEIRELTYAEQWAAHRWEVEIEGSITRLRCLDPCETYECTPECASHRHPEVIRRGMIFNEIEAREACDCGQYAKFLQAFEAAKGRICACMATSEEVECLTGLFPVTIEYVDDSTPSTPDGYYEHSHYLAVFAKVADEKD